MLTLEEIQKLIEIIEKHEETINCKSLYDKLKLHEKGFQLSNELNDVEKTLREMNQPKVEIKEK